MKEKGVTLRIPLTHKIYNLDKSNSNLPACGNSLHGKNSLQIAFSLSSRHFLTEHNGFSELQAEFTFGVN